MTRNRTAWAVGLLALAAAAWSPRAARAEAAPAVARSSSTARELTVADLYHGAKYRDPFQTPSAGGGGASAAGQEAFKMENFSIHSLNLKGIMKDGAGAYAILADGQTSASFVLKGGVLFDFRNKRVPGVTGTIQMRRKTVTLMTADKDVQPLKMGEAGENLKKAAP